MYLVTGGAGFIGSHIAEHLVSDSKEVRVLDNLSVPGNPSKQFLQTLGIELVKGDITDKQNLLDSFRGIETVFHEAAMASVPQSIAEPDLCYKINVEGTKNVLEAARSSGTKNVVFASSSAVYGDLPGLPKKEDSKTFPMSPYAQSKLDGEELMQEYSSLYGINCVSLRYFNVYGARQNPKSDYAAVIPKFIERAKTKEPLVIYGDGTATRDFVNARDVARANVAAVGKTGVYNIASGTPISVLELAEIIVLARESNSKITFEPPRLGDILHSHADISKAKKELLWEPKTPLELGIKELCRQ